MRKTMMGLSLICVMMLSAGFVFSQDAPRDVVVEERGPWAKVWHHIRTLYKEVDTLKNHLTRLTNVVKEQAQTDNELKRHVAHLEEENKQIKGELCRRDPTYSWCPSVRPTPIPTR